MNPASVAQYGISVVGVVVAAFGVGDGDDAVNVAESAGNACETGIPVA